MTPDKLASVLDALGVVSAYRLYVAARGYTTVLCLHGVSPRSSPLYPLLRPEQLRALCEYVRTRYEVCLFRDLDGRSRSCKPKLVLSFDDGYRDFIEYAVPILERAGLRANQNIITGCAHSGRPYTWRTCLDFLGQHRAGIRAGVERLGLVELIPFAEDPRLGLAFTRWFQEQPVSRLDELERTLDAVRRVEPFAECAMMSWEEIRQIDGFGFEIGSHTVTHASLDRLGPVSLAEEIGSSKRDLEGQLGHPVDVIAFPAGRYDQVVLDACRGVGYRHLVGVGDRLNRAEPAVWSRILVYGESDARLRLRAVGLEPALRRQELAWLHRTLSVGVVEPLPVVRAFVPGRVSVVVPNHNAEAYLAETLRSVVAQTYQDWELIVVDDGSTDRSSAIAMEFARADRRIMYLRQENSGVSSARNAGLARSCGEFIAFLDSDDVWLPGNLAAKVNFLRRRPGCGLVHSDLEVIDSRSQRTGERHSGKEGRLLDSLLLWEGDNIPAPSNVLFRRAVVQEVGGFDLELSTAADQDLYIRLASAIEVGRQPGIYTLYRVHPAAMHLDIERMERDHIRVYRKAAREARFRGFWFKRRCFSNLFLILAGSWLHEGRSRLRAALFLARALLHYPPNVLTIAAKARKRISLSGTA